MPNYQHIQWLKEGIPSWNRRRDSDSFTPDLSQMILPEHFPGVSVDGAVRRITLSGANLSGAILNGSNLAHADFIDADFSGANLRLVYASQSNFSGARFPNADLTEFVARAANFSGADFSDADLSNANLPSSDLSDCDLTGAIFTRAILDGTDLSNAILAKTNFVEAKLNGAKFFGTAPRLAEFYPEYGAPNEKAGVSQAPISRVSDLLNAVVELGSQNPLYFRGEPALGLRLSPSVIRDELSEYEGDMLRDLRSRRPQEMRDMGSALDQWVIARHHGLKTRFLDVTKNPLVALYFACAEDAQYDDQDACLHIFGVPEALIKRFDSDTISVIANLATLPKPDQDLLLSPPAGGLLEPRVALDFNAKWGRLYQLLEREKSHFEERIEIKDLYGVFVVEPQQSSDRVRAQSGAFLVSAFRERFDYPEGTDWNGGVRPYNHSTMPIPSYYKEHIRNELRMLDVTHETLFPGLDSSAAAITDSYSRRRQSSEM